MLTESERIKRLSIPGKRQVTAVLDTDAYNEVDDPFALAYALLSERIDLKAVFAAPYDNARSEGPADGMEKSYREILKILNILHYPDNQMVFRGAMEFMPQKDKPVETEASRRLVEIARSMSEPLYVLTIGCATNVASALLMDPSLVDKLVVLWLGGHPQNWPRTDEFNLKQDLYASRVLFDSGVPMVRFPCAQVAEQLVTTLPELDACLGGRSDLGDYLVTMVRDYAPQGDQLFAWSKVIWDIIAVAWLDCPEAITSVLCPTPRLIGHSKTPRDELCLKPDFERPLYREAVAVRRDLIFRRVFQLINATGQ